MSTPNRRVGASFQTGGGAHPPGQRGAVLIFALIILVIMSVLAISGVGDSLLEYRMAGNYSQTITAFQAAEQGLRVAEEWLHAKRSSDGDFRDMSAGTWWFKATDATDGLYSAMSSHPDGAKVCNGDDGCEFNPRDETQWCSSMAESKCKLPKGFATLGETLRGRTLSTVGVDQDGDGAIDSLAKQPQFIIEYIGSAGTKAPVITFGKRNGDAPLQAFRITVIAWGKSDTVRQTLQSHVLLDL